MPIYEYKCDACGHVLDALQKVDEQPLKFCPSCSEETLRKLISAPSFRLKGTGWYETDFKKDNKRNLADGGTAAPKAAAETKKDKAAGASAGKTDSGSAASKPATKSAD
jgi:putative FmdB family regulatory protein